MPWLPEETDIDPYTPPAKDVPIVAQDVHGQQSAASHTARGSRYGADRASSTAFGFRSMTVK